MKTNLDKLVQVRVSAQDMERLKAAAERRHLNVSAWLRALALEEADRLLGEISPSPSKHESA
jgi:predicted DNA binding CopG/RHH family protein